MPSIPLYGFDELEQSILNSAKRRVVGLMDVSQEQLTEKPETDPTNGKQDTFVEQLTEEVYSAIKDIEVLDTYISDTSSIEELRLTTDRQPDTLRTLRPELKKGASQIASVNNALRKINTAYDRLRPNMVYTDLKTFTGFVNSVSILKKSALRFFDIVDDLIDNVNKAKGIVYVRPVINKDEEPEIEEPPSVEIPSIGMDVATPIPEPVIAPQEPEPIPAPPPPPPPPKRNSLIFKRQMKKYKELIETLLQQNNIGDQNEKNMVLRYALEYERTNNVFLTEQEIQDYIDQTILNPPQLPIAPITPAPSTAPAVSTLTQKDVDAFQRLYAQKINDQGLSPDEIKDLDKLVNDFLTANSNTAFPDEEELDDFIGEVNPEPKTPFSRAPTAIMASTGSTGSNPIDDLIDEGERITRTGFLFAIPNDRIIQRSSAVIRARDEKRPDLDARVRDLKELVDIYNKPVISAETTPDPKKFPEYKKLFNKYINTRKALNSNYKKYEDPLRKYMVDNSIKIKTA